MHAAHRRAQRLPSVRCDAGADLEATAGVAVCTPPVVESHRHAPLRLDDPAIGQHRHRTRRELIVGEASREPIGAGAELHGDALTEHAAGLDMATDIPE
jgi:hypothetical protein